jgi:hypothetical protein
MRLFRLSLCGMCVCVAGLRAQTNQQDDENKQAPPEEIPDFSQLDEYTYVPKSTLSIGDRLFVRGPKSTYSGQGSLPGSAYPGTSALIPNIQRTYNDGYVDPDGRIILVTDGVGSGTTAPAASDGRTNTWGYENDSQILPNGDIAFHSYSANIIDQSVHEQNGQSTAGMELILDRDMGKLGKRLKWSITAGLSIADIRSDVYASVPATEVAVTDTYDLFGQVPPPAVYNSPATVTQATGAGADTATEVADTSTLIGNVPLGRTTSTVSATVTNRYFTDGAYYTFRIGPTLTLPMGKHWNLNFSAGPAIIFAGEEMNVVEDLALTTNEPDLLQLYQKENNKLVPGVYADVDLQYQLTETAGFYVGGVYQEAGTFTQSISSGAGTSYVGKTDFGSQEGLKTGMTVRF